jgi:23S rRNA pseudouridine1911/1915/1917 synthase
MIVHPQRIEDRGTLVQALLHYDEKIKEAIYDPNSAISRMRPGIVHRLDKDTSGVLVVAKNRDALTILAQQFQKHLVIKDYTALVYGDLAEKKVIHTNLGRKKADHKSLMAAKPLQSSGREAISTFFPEKFFVYSPTSEKVTLLGCRIETGRTHQIRVHAKYGGYPVLGDSLYRTKLSQGLSQKLGIERQMLHASKLKFSHPESGKRVEFEVELPEDMLQVLTKLKRA